jgi:conjugative relaxase-like TrwC/TraI family protein
MLTISKPLSAGQVHRYHAEEFANASANYYTEADRIHGQWHGRLADDWGLSGAVDEHAFAQLAEGRHPTTGEELVRHQPSRTYVNERGRSITTREHRAGWDATFSAPKSVSLTALVGGDDRVREAHRESVTVALNELERYVQARIGGSNPAETTGRWAAARFEHDSARPVNGYAAPQLHTHVVIFNVTDTEEHGTRSLQPRELYRSQRFATAVYRSELATRLQALGYEIERDAIGQFEIKGYSREYLDASSPRRQQIKERLEQSGHRGLEAAEIVAHWSREAKLDASHTDMQRRHRDLAEAHGNQPAHVVESAHEHERQLGEGRQHTHAQHAATAVTYATDRNIEREAVVDERLILRDALRRSLGESTVESVRIEFENRVSQGDLVSIQQPADSPARAFTTPGMRALEEETIQAMREGRGKYERLAGEETVGHIAAARPTLSDSQRAAVEQLAASRDQVMALEGVAGAGKTTTLAAVRDAAQREGYLVEGLAPTSRAAQQLADAGLESGTLQRFLARGQVVVDGQPSLGALPATETRPHLYVLDESSLASTRQMHDFLERLGDRDRVLLVGDTRQHQAVEAGKPYQQLQEAGLDLARLDDVIRQKDPALKAVVEQLSRGEVAAALRQLDAQGRVHEIPDHDARLRAVTAEYLKDSSKTLVVSPDNRSRAELNQAIHEARQTASQVAKDEHQVRVLVPRQDVTGADRQWAEQYQHGDVVRYTTGSRAIGLDRREYATVQSVTPDTNRLTVARATGEEVTYDPRRLQGVTIYREADRVFAVGDRVQATAPDRERRVANRELGTVESITATDGGRTLTLKLDSGRTATYDLNSPSSRLHLDHGYAVTSHSSQGLTADRVILHVDTDRAGESLVNRRLAYVAISRGRYDAHVYTNDKAHLAYAIDRDVSHRAALEPAAGLSVGRSVGQSHGPQAIQPAKAPTKSIGLGLDM